MLCFFKDLEFSRQPAGVERVSRVSQIALNPNCGRVRATEDAPRGPYCLLERRYGIAEITVCGTIVLGERPRVVPPHHECGDDGDGL